MEQSVVQLLSTVSFGELLLLIEWSKSNKLIFILYLFILIAASQTSQLIHILGTTSTDAGAGNIISKSSGDAQHDNKCILVLVVTNNDYYYIQSTNVGTFDDKSC